MSINTTNKRQKDTQPLGYASVNVYARVTMTKPEPDILKTVT